MNIDGMAQFDAVLAAALAAHRPIGSEEPLLPNKGPFAASPEGLSGWVQHAGSGQVCVYARAENAPALVAKQARDLEARGLVRLRRGRHPARPNLFDFMARRTDLKFAAARTVAPETTLSPPAKLLMETLSALADAGKPLMNNRDLAATIGIKNADSISNLLCKLKAAQLITVDFDPATSRREIEILLTGARVTSA
jgi:hypothetical protein